MAHLHKQDFETSHAPTWCPGCGNFAIWTSLKKALIALGIPPHKVLIVFGVGCSGNMGNTLGTYGWHSLHGRALPTGIGAKLANKDLTVIIAAGDGDSYGEGMSHFIHAMRGNTDVTYLVHNNSVYGLTTGQAAPTAQKGFKGKSTPDGLIEEPINPISLALSVGAQFVARGFSGDTDFLTDLIKQAILFPGFSLVDIFQPCVTFNKINTYTYYNSIIERLDADITYSITDRKAALLKSLQFKKLPIGLFYKGAERKSYLDELPYLKNRSLVSKSAQKRNIQPLFAELT